MTVMLTSMSSSTPPILRTSTPRTMATSPDYPHSHGSRGYLFGQPCGAFHTDGATVAVPNDASNRARAYLLLQKIGWIEADESADFASLSEANVTSNPHNLQFTEMKSLSIPAVAQDFDYIVITGSIVYNAKIDPATSALATEDILDHLILQSWLRRRTRTPSGRRIL